MTIRNQYNIWPTLLNVDTSPGQNQNLNFYAVHSLSELSSGITQPVRGLLTLELWHGPLLPLVAPLLATAERPAERYLVGILQIAPDRQSMSQPGNSNAQRLDQPR